jgi:hypothetical protein
MKFANFEILIWIVFLILLIGLYIIYARLLIKLAKKLGIKKNLWFLYIPLLQNYIFYQMAGSSVWTFILSILFFIPFVSVLCYVMPVIWFWKIAKKLGYSGWWGIIFPLWVFILEWETKSDEEKKKEQLKIAYAKSHKKEIEEKEKKDFRRWIRDMIIIFSIIILIILIKVIFF